MLFGYSSHVYCAGALFSFLGPWMYRFHQMCKVFDHYVFKPFFCPLRLPFRVPNHGYIELPDRCRPTAGMLSAPFCVYSGKFPSLGLPGNWLFLPGVCSDLPLIPYSRFRASDTTDVLSRYFIWIFFCFNCL